MLEFENPENIPAQQIGYPMQSSYIPSIDFGLFQLPQFGELFSNSLGIGSRFSASDPTGYVNNSVNTLASILQPSAPLQMPSLPNYGQGIELPSAFANLPPLIQPMFQNPRQAPQGQNAPSPYRDPPPIIIDVGDKTIDLGKGSVYPFPTTGGTTPINTGKKCPEGESEYSDVFGFKHCGKSMVSDGSGSGDSRVIGGDVTKSGDKVGTIADWFKGMPKEAGGFLIAIAVIVLIFLFIKK